MYTFEDALKDLISQWKDKLTGEEIRYFLRTAAEYYREDRKEDDHEQS
jgi:hypothetical protein